MSEHKNMLTDGNVGKALLIIALPIIISNMLQSVLEVVDMHFIGELGDTSIAGGTLSVSVIMVLTTILMGIVTATAAFVSRAYGSEKYERIQVVSALRDEWRCLQYRRRAIVLSACLSRVCNAAFH